MTGRVGTVCLIVLGLALLLTALSPLASSRPDGLERVAEDHAPVKPAQPGPGRPGELPVGGPAPMPDYKLPGVRSDALGTILAGSAGTLLVFALALGLGRLIRSRRKTPVVQGRPGETPSSR